MLVTINPQYASTGQPVDEVTIVNEPTGVNVALLESFGRELFISWRVRELAAPERLAVRLPIPQPALADCYDALLRLWYTHKGHPVQFVIDQVSDQKCLMVMNVVDSPQKPLYCNESEPGGLYPLKDVTFEQAERWVEQYGMGHRPCVIFLPAGAGKIVAWRDGATQQLRMQVIHPGLPNEKRALTLRAEMADKPIWSVQVVRETNDV